MPIHVDTCVLLCICVYLQLLATVLSQSAKAKEHLLEQSKSVDQPAGRTREEQRGCFFISVTGIYSDDFTLGFRHEFTETIHASIMKVARTRGREILLIERKR